MLRLVKTRRDLTKSKPLLSRNKREASNNERTTNNNNNNNNSRHARQSLNLSSPICVSCLVLNLVTIHHFNTIQYNTIQLGRDQSILLLQQDLRITVYLLTHATLVLLELDGRDDTTRHDQRRINQSVNQSHESKIKTLSHHIASHLYFSARFLRRIQLQLKGKRYYK